MIILVLFTLIGVKCGLVEETFCPVLSSNGTMTRCLDGTVERYGVTIGNNTSLSRPPVEDDDVLVSAAGCPAPPCPPCPPYPANPNYKEYPPYAPDPQYPPYAQFPPYPNYANYPGYPPQPPQPMYPTYPKYPAYGGAAGVGVTAVSGGQVLVVPLSTTVTLVPAQVTREVSIETVYVDHTTNCHSIPTSFGTSLIKSMGKFECIGRIARKVNGVVKEAIHS